MRCGLSLGQCGVRRPADQPDPAGPRGDDVSVRLGREA